jgi:hypothetical protein
LVVAASLTRSERQAREHSEQLHYLLTEGGIAWHSPWRARLALYLARQLFTGAKAVENLQTITEQRGPFVDRIIELEDPDLDYGARDEEGLRLGRPAKQQNGEGRAATAVWRAARSIALDALAEWFVDGSPQRFIAEPPGWVLRPPGGWESVPFRHSDPIPSHIKQWLAAGRVLRIDWGSRSALWPLIGSRRPVDGFEHVVAGAQQLRLSPVQIAEALLVPRPFGEAAQGEDELPDDVEYPHRPRFSVKIAHQVGLVDQSELDEVIADADRYTRARVDEVLDTAKRRGLPAGDLQDLRDAAGNPSRFARLAKEHGIRFWVSPANWTWDVDSVPAVLRDHNLTPQQLRLLGREWCRQVTRALEQDMENAWHQASWWAWAEDKV